MPNLPPVAIEKQADYDRVLAAFNGDVVAYRRFIRRSVRRHTLQVEAARARREAPDLLAEADNIEEGEL